MLVSFMRLVLILSLSLYSHALLASPEKLTAGNNSLHIEGAEVTLHVTDAQLLARSDILLDWINYSAYAVKNYYARFPVDRLRLELIAYDGQGVRSGHAYGGDTPLVEVFIGNRVTEAQLKKDWVLVHEMVHLALAQLPRRHHWFVEGLAVYIESVARVEAGQLARDIVWRSFMKSMPKGLPKAGDRGLDFTPTWGRRYWGGALFCLLADIQIREKTNNRSGLRQAMQAILNNGCSMKRFGNIEALMEMADKATGHNVLSSMYQQMKDTPVTTDLPALWQSLGVSLQQNRVVYDDSAPKAPIRQQLF